MDTMLQGSCGRKQEWFRVGHRKILCNLKIYYATWSLTNTLKNYVLSNFPHIQTVALWSIPSSSTLFRMNPLDVWSIMNIFCNLLFHFLLFLCWRSFEINLCTFGLFQCFDIAHIWILIFILHFPPSWL